ncbi:MAG TPA: type II toxin-antitoxin system HicB family antitoxin [Acidobacteriota bacterium]|nr:type II toxin-antitoxin system HicB family antitoxin [Acidobacteriota bacterium]HNT18260.1 type II toxin-antitoxin system HicB family antitoxin [Acidobacteriota bacterium]
MKTAKFVYWKEEKFWLGYFEEFPDYKTQGKTLAELKENLRDLYKDLTSGDLPGIKRVATLKIA